MQASAQNNIAEEVAWVVGDEPIYKSDIEEQYMQLQYERQPIEGNPYCVIPERMAIEKLFLQNNIFPYVVIYVLYLALLSLASIRIAFGRNEYAPTWTL